MKLIFSLILLAASATSTDLQYFKYERPVVLSTQKQGQTCLALDAEVFSKATPRLADLRLYRGDVETPYVIKLPAPQAGEEKTIAPVNLGLQNKQTVFDAAMPVSSYSDLVLNVSAQNFVASVTVSGSHSEKGVPLTRLGTYTIFDLTRQKLGRSTVLHLPSSNFQYLHFQISSPVVPENITGLSVERLPASEPHYQLVAESTQVMQKDHHSVVQFTVPAHVPIDRITFVPGTDPAAFSREAIINVVPLSEGPVSNDAEPSPSITASGNLLRLHTTQDDHRIDEENLAVDAPRTIFDTPTKWTISIDNGDDAPLILKSTRLEMLERTLCFEAADQARYSLYYGDSERPAPRYDYAMLFAQQADAGKADLGPEQQNPAYNKRPDDRPFTEKHPALLWAGLIGVIVLLGSIALRSKQPTHAA